MNRAFTFALIASAVLHVGLAAALLEPRERAPALPMLTASLRPAVALSQPMVERPQAATMPSQVPKGRPRMKEADRTQANPPAASATGAESVAAAETALVAPPAAMPALAVEPPRYDAAYLENPPPAYPRSAKRRGIEGTVMLEALISASGDARDIRLVASAGDSLLDEAAREAVRHWRFAPARRGAEAVEAWVRIPVVYKIN